MEILLFALGIVFVIVGLPFCFSCQIHALWENRSRGKTNQKNQPPYPHARRDRGVGLVFMIIGVLLIFLSFAGSVM
jgi:uncharacterized protein YjeT (DUF2065 family)